MFGTFSNLQYVNETGDVIGLEITIVPQYLTAYAIFQCAEGSPSPPVFVPVTIKGNRVSLTVSRGDTGCEGIYSGVVTARGLTLDQQQVGPATDRFLPRRASYWSR